jgi:hypothetical protein
LYYIYYDDASLGGGGVTFNATTTKETALNGSGRFFVGSVLTPAATAANTTGNNDGGTGSQIGTTTVTQTTQGSSTTGYDVSPFSGIGTQVGAGTMNATWSAMAAPANLFFATSKTLVISSVVTFTSATGTAKLEYSLNGGGSFTTIYNTNVNRTGVDSVSLSVGQDISQIQVRGTVTVSSGTRIAQNVRTIYMNTVS